MVEDTEVETEVLAEVVVWEGGNGDVSRRPVVWRIGRGVVQGVPALIAVGRGGIVCAGVGTISVEEEGEGRSVRVEIRVVRVGIAEWRLISCQIIWINIFNQIALIELPYIFGFLLYTQEVVKGLEKAWFQNKARSVDQMFISWYSGKSLDKTIGISRLKVHK